ncbi:MAG: LCP family protein, partial [Roseiflexaceae bacterium]
PAPQADAPKPARKQPRPAPPADAPKPARKQPRPAPQAWSWQHFVVLTVVTIVVSYVIIVGVKAGWDALRIWQGLGIISSSSTPVATELAPAAEPLTETPLATPVPLTPTAAQIILPAGSDQPLTVLLLGSDRRPQESGTARTDAVMVMRIIPQTKKISLLSFPRDLMVNIPGYGWARINAANVYGDLYPQLGGGMQLATQTVSTVIGQPIDYTVLVDFAGFINIINALGGVAVDVPKELYDAQFPTMDYKYREAYFPVGSTMMDGDTALTYSRIRHPDNDFERTTRQQSVIIGIGERLLSGNYLTTLDTAATVTDALIGHAKTDMPREKIIALAWQMREIDMQHISRFTLRDIYYGSGDDRYAMYPVDGAISRIVSQWLAQ